MLAPPAPTAPGLDLSPPAWLTGGAWPTCEPDVPCSAGVDPDACACANPSPAALTATAPGISADPAAARCAAGAPFPAAVRCAAGAPFAVDVPFAPGAPASKRYRLYCRMIVIKLAP